LEVWQGLELAADFADVWQRKDLLKMEKGKSKLVRKRRGKWKSESGNLGREEAAAAAESEHK
jgi:hypothetical protein